MKNWMAICLTLILCGAAYPQTQNLGMGAFANDEGPILLAVDASLADRTPDSPYLMFVLFMAAKDQGQMITVARDSVVMVVKGQEYQLPSVQELRTQYRGELRDLGFYRRLGKEGIISSWIRFYEFPQRTDFFPPLTLRSPLAVDEGSMSGRIGFSTVCYFKNPGLVKGDEILIRVRDKKNPDLAGEVAVKL